MNTIKSYKALNVDQSELIKRLIKENKILIKKNKEREEFYRRRKDNLLRMREYHKRMKYSCEYLLTFPEDGNDYRTHDDCLQTITSILEEEYG
jgi:hypothetical protein